MGLDPGTTTPDPVAASGLAERTREHPRDEVGRDLACTRWEERFPRLRCGITTAFDVDYGLSRGDACSRLEAYSSLGARHGFETVAVGRQVHGTEVRTLEAGAISGLLIAGPVDGVATARPGLLLAATAADCVPVHLYDPVSGSLGLLHAGWRGTAGGILGVGIDALIALGGARDSIHVHLGPAICGACYEVDTPVLHALGLRGNRAHIDLRAVLAEQARAAGIASGRVSISAWCTRCSEGLLHSHRGTGPSAGRMAAYLGLKATDEGVSDPTS